MLAHGHRDKADHPGEVDQTAALDAGFAGIAAGLNAQGYAVAARSYSDNGWAVKEAIHDVTALTSFFRETVAVPESTLLVGFSLGSFPTYELAERTGGLFDGFLPSCAVGAGAPRAWDGGLLELLAYRRRQPGTTSSTTRPSRGRSVLTMHTVVDTLVPVQHEAA